MKFELEKSSKESERLHLQVHHIDNLEFLVMNVGKRLNKLSRRDEVCPWEIVDKSLMKRVALEESHKWAEWIVEKWVGTAIREKRDLRKYFDRLRIGKGLESMISDHCREVWESGQILDLSSELEYEFGFSTDFVRNEYGNILELGIRLTELYYFEDLFGELPQGESKKKVMLASKNGEFPKVTKMIAGYRELGFKFVSTCADDPFRRVILDRKQDGFCAASGDDREFGKHCYFPSSDINNDRNTDNFRRIVRIAEPEVYDLVEQDGLVETMEITAGELWELLRIFDWL